MGRQENKIQSDIPRYRKRSAKHAPQKADHRHNYEPCVFMYHVTMFSDGHGFHTGENTFKIGSYCQVCGKIGPGPDLNSSEWYTREKNGRWVKTDWSEKARREFNPATRTLPCFRLEDPWFQKTVDLERDAE